MTEEKILKSSDEAAKFVTGISGWVGGDGRYYGDNEDLARWAGCTHIECEKCGSVYKRDSWCEPCRQNRAEAQFEELEYREWDGETPLHLHDTDTYFFSLEDVADHLEEHGGNVSDLKLVLCKPVAMNEVDEEQLLEGMHEDAELEEPVAKALVALNEAIRQHPTSCWEPDIYATSVSL